MVNFYETKCFLQNGFTEDQLKKFREHRFSQKGKHLWGQINTLNVVAKNLCSTYDESWCFSKFCCYRRYKHLPFQCDYNDNEILASYSKGNYDYDNMEKN